MRCRRAPGRLGNAFLSIKFNRVFLICRQNRDRIAIPRSIQEQNIAKSHNPMGKYMAPMRRLVGGTAQRDFQLAITP